MTADQFRAALAELGFTQAGFAALTGEHVQTVNKRCRGRLAIPSYIELIVTLLRERQKQEHPTC